MKILAGILILLLIIFIIGIIDYNNKQTKKLKNNTYVEIDTRITYILMGVGHRLNKKKEMISIVKIRMVNGNYIYIMDMDDFNVLFTRKRYNE